jgi:hypothetical protein
VSSAGEEEGHVVLMLSACLLVSVGESRAKVVVVRVTWDIGLRRTLVSSSSHAC